MVRKTARRAYMKKAKKGMSVAAMKKKADKFGSKVSYLDQDAKKGKKVHKAKAGLKKVKPSQKGLKKLPTAVRNKMGYAKSGTKKGMVRKTARKAYMAKSGTKKGMVRKTARKAYMKKGGKMSKCRMGCR